LLPHFGSIAAVTQEGFGDKGFVAYRVHDDVQRHEAMGLGM